MIYIYNLAVVCNIFRNKYRITFQELVKPQNKIHQETRDTYWYKMREGNKSRTRDAPGALVNGENSSVV